MNHEISTLLYLIDHVTYHLKGQIEKMERNLPNEGDFIERLRQPYRLANKADPL